MKEILFRGKRIDNGEWVKGSLLQGKQADYEANGKYKGMKDCTIIVPKSELSAMNLDYCGECAVPYDPHNSYEVYPETVGQFTGLTDKNGKKIFEGDILQDKFGQVKIVDYYNPWGAFRTCFVKTLDEEGKIVLTTGGASFVGDIWKSYEIVGNIHDNPEVLK